MLHTPNCHAAAGVMEEQASSFLARGICKVAFWRSSAAKKSIDLNSLELGEITLDVKSAIAPTELAPSFTQHLSVLKERISAFSDTPLGATVVIFAGMVLVVYSVYLFLVGFSAWFDGIPFDVSSKRLTHSFLDTFQPLDVCQNYFGNRQDVERMRWFSHFDHASGSEGVPFAEALQQWINNDLNLISMLGGVVLADRAVGVGHFQNPHEFESQFKTFLFANAATMKKNYTCSFKLGESDHLDAITGCQEDLQKEISMHVPEAADAIINFRRWNKRKFESPRDLMVKLSFNHDNRIASDVARGSAQRRFSQLGSSITLPEDMAIWLKQSTAVMQNLWSVANTLNQGVCNNETEGQLNQLRTAVQEELTSRGAGLNGYLGCDIRFNNAETEAIQCHLGTGPEPEFTVGGCDLESNVVVPWDGKLWFKSNAGLVDSVSVSASHEWQSSSRSQTHPNSPSMDITNSQQKTPSVDVSRSDSETVSDSVDITNSQQKTQSADVSTSGSETVSKAESESMSKAESESMSNTVTHTSPTPSQTQSRLNTTGDGITELYSFVTNKLSRITVNATSYINETLMSTFISQPSRPSYSPINNTIYWMDYTNGCCNSNELLIVKRGIVSGNLINSPQTSCTFQFLGNSVTDFHVSPDTNDVFLARGSVGMGATIYWAPYNHQSNTCTQVETQIQSGPGLGIASNQAYNLYYDLPSQKLLVRYSLTYIVVWDFNATAPTAQLKNPFCVYNRSISENEIIESMVYDQKSRELYLHIKYNSTISTLKKASFDFGNPAYLTNFQWLHTFATNPGALVGIGN